MVIENYRESYINKLQVIAESKLFLLESILRITRAQSLEIEADNQKKLERLIDDKQKLIDEINEIDEEFNLYFDKLKSELKIESSKGLDISSIEGTDKLQKIISRIFQCINEISSVEKENKSGVKRLVEEIEKEIKKINLAKMTNAAYSPKLEKEPSYFIDKKK